MYLWWQGQTHSDRGKDIFSFRYLQHLSTSIYNKYSLGFLTLTRIICDDNGIFPDCGDLKAPEHGHVTINETLRIAIVSCDEGYELSGAEIVTCETASSTSGSHLCTAIGKRKNINFLFILAFAKRCFFFLKHVEIVVINHLLIRDICISDSLLMDIFSFILVFFAKCLHTTREILK